MAATALWSLALIAFAAAVDVRDLDPWRHEKQVVEKWVSEGNGTVFFAASAPGLDDKVFCAVAVLSGARIPSDASGGAKADCSPRAAERPRAWHGLPEAAVAYADHFRVAFYAAEQRLPAALAFTRFAFVGIVRDPLAAIAGGTEGDPKRVKQYVDRQVSHYVGCAQSVDQLLGRAKLEASAHRTGRTRTLPHYRRGFEYDAALERDVPEGARSNAGVRHKPNCAQALVDFHRPTRDDLEAAKRRLDRFSLVLPLERLAEAGPLLAAKFGYGNVAPVTLWNYTAASEPEAAVLAAVKAKTPTIYTAMRRNTALDRELHAYAGCLLDKALEALANNWSGAVACPRDRTGEVASAVAPVAVSAAAHPAAELNPARATPPALVDAPFPMFRDAAPAASFSGAAIEV